MRERDHTQRKKGLQLERLVCNLPKYDLIPIKTAIENLMELEHKNLHEERQD